MRDFTFHIFRELLQVLKQRYKFQPFAEFLKAPEHYAVILRHDVDARSQNSLITADIEASLGLQGTYYFRMVPSSYNAEVITKIASLGHEIGYHYEDLSAAKGNCEKAIHFFEQNLAKLRRLAPVTTICMHGSPLSRFDNRRLWYRYDYHQFGIIGEPYLDLDFGQILYLTDTGRRWDGKNVSVRDKISENVYKKFSFHSTFDVIKAAKDNNLPAKIMITVHPQRWDDHILPWIKEYIMQNLKNLIKRAVVRSDS